MSDNVLPTAIQTLADQMESFEASKSVANTGTGARREGEKFEHLALHLWDSLKEHLTVESCSVSYIKVTETKKWVRLCRGVRSVYLPCSTIPHGSKIIEPPQNWLDTQFHVEHLISQYPGMDTAIAEYAPPTGPYAEKCYPNMFSRMKTQFDGTIVLENDGVLTEKILLEYKTSKSSVGVQIDGNAHERLSFQIMQYLEVATLYPSCSLCVLTNGAFIKYRNKYHANFHVQSSRLKAFRWFQMEYYCCANDYAILINKITNWINHD